MEEGRRLNLVVGLFVAGALVFLAVALFTLGSQNMLRPRYELVTYFDDVQGLVPGSPVRLAGQEVGSVEHVTFAPLGEDVPPVRVVLQIDSAVADRIRSDSVASIGTVGLLGDKYVELSMGSPEGQVLEPGDEIASVSPLDLNVALVRGTQAIDSIAELADNMNKVVVQFGSAMGGRNMAQTLEGVTAIVREIEEGKGLLHSLVYDPYEGRDLEKLSHTLQTLDEIFAEIAGGQGLLHQLIYEAPPDQAVLGEALAAAARLEHVLAKIDEGEGTLGLLVNDPSLYDDLRTLLGGAQRSLVVRSLIRLSSGSD